MGIELLYLIQVNKRPMTTRTISGILPTNHAMSYYLSGPEPFLLPNLEEKKKKTPPKGIGQGAGQQARSIKNRDPHQNPPWTPSLLRGFIHGFRTPLQVVQQNKLTLMHLFIPKKNFPTDNLHPRAVKKPTAIQSRQERSKSPRVKHTAARSPLC